MDLQEVKQVIELENEKQVNSYLKKGWKLLSVGFQSRDGESAKCYILGSSEFKLSEEHQKFVTKFLNE